MSVAELLLTEESWKSIMNERLFEMVLCDHAQSVGVNLAGIIELSYVQHAKRI
jgi:hypothetical protein